MNVYVSIEHRFSRTPDGVHWTSGTYACSFWERYLAVFDSVTVLARVAEVEPLRQVIMPSPWTALPSRHFLIIAGRCTCSFVSPPS